MKTQTNAQTWSNNLWILEINALYWFQTHSTHMRRPPTPLGQPCSQYLLDHIFHILATYETYMF